MRPLRRSLAALALFAGVLVACETVPITGRTQLNLISEPDEVKMGAQAYREIVGKAKVSGDGVANAQVTRVAQRIITVSDKPNLPWEVTVIEEHQANAFALPGGKIAVYTGMLLITRDDAGLAAVIGHEVATCSRVTARSGEPAAGGAGLGGALAAGLAPIRPSASRSRGSSPRGSPSRGGRKQESEADYIGLILMAKAGYDPGAARDLWVRMGEASKGRFAPAGVPLDAPVGGDPVRQIEEWLPRPTSTTGPADRPPTCPPPTPSLPPFPPAAGHRYENPPPSSR
jgi:predicted Zn-dependent protease